MPALLDGRASTRATGDSVVTNFTAPATDITLCTLGLGTVSAIAALGTLEITSL